MTKTTDNITVDAKQLDEIISLYMDVVRYSEYEGNDMVDRAVASKQAKAIMKVMDILGIAGRDINNAKWNIITGRWEF